MKKISVFLILIFNFLNYTKGNQLVFWTENFNQTSSGCLPNSSPYSWAVTNIGGQGTNANEWYINSSVESQLGSCYSQNFNTELGALFIGFGNSNCDSANLGAYYKKGCDNSTNKRVVSPLIDCSGRFDIVLECDLMIRNYFPNDFGSAFISFNGGSTWDTLEYKINSGFCPSFLHSGFWEHRSFLLPDSADNNPNVKISFTWTNNDDCFGTENSFAIDNIKLALNCNLKAGISTLDTLAPPVEFCAGVEYSFRPTSGYLIDSLYWDCGNGQFSNDLNVDITYSSPGTYLIQLFVVDTNGCIDAATTSIYVNGFVASIATSNNSVCPYGIIDFYSLVTPTSILGIPNHYSWNFFDGIPGTSSNMNPHNQFIHAGNYSPVLTVSNPLTSCIKSTSVPIEVDTCGYPVLSSIFASPDFQICVGDCIDFSSDAYNAISYSWSFPGAATTTSSFSSPSNICYPNAGIYNVTLTVTNASGSITLTKHVTVFSYPPIPVLSLMYSSGDLSGVICNLTSSFFLYEWYYEYPLGTWTLLTDNTFYISPLTYQDSNYKVRVANGISACYSESSPLFVPPE